MTRASEKGGIKEILSQDKKAKEKTGGETHLPNSKAAKGKAWGETSRTNPKVISDPVERLRSTTGEKREKSLGRKRGLGLLSDQVVTTDSKERKVSSPTTSPQGNKGKGNVSKETKLN